MRSLGHIGFYKASIRCMYVFIYIYIERERETFCKAPITVITSALLRVQGWG